MKFYKFIFGLICIGVIAPAGIILHSQESSTQESSIIFKEQKENRNFSTVIEVDIFKPITFKVDTNLKPGWSTTDRITPLRTTLVVPPQVSYIKQQDGTFYCWAPPGNYQLSSDSILINWTKQDIDERLFAITLIVKGTSPVPPTPVPDVDPPTPQPNNPFTTDKLKVLFVEEQDERGDATKITPEQLGFFGTAEVRDYLDENFEWFFLDKDTVFTSDNDFKRAMSLPRTINWWIVIGNKTKFESVPLPKTKDQLMTLLRKYAS